MGFRATYWRGLGLGCVVLAAGCAPSVGPLEPGSPATLIHYLNKPSGELRTEGAFEGANGAVLGCIGYRLPGSSADTALVYLHGIESHAGWFDMAATRLAHAGYDVYCLDRRGSGINRENRGYPSGHIDAFEILLADVRSVVVPLRHHYKHVYVVGLSWGGKLALAYGLTHPDDCDGLVLITPGIRSLVDLTPGRKLDVLFAHNLNPKKPIPVPIEPEMFTTTPKYLNYIKQDPLRLKQATARFFMQSHRLDGYIDKRIASHRLPTLLFLAGQERIIDNQGVLDVLGKADADRLTVIEYDDQTHSVQFDAPDRLVGDMCRWLKHIR